MTSSTCSHRSAEHARPQSAPGPGLHAAIDRVLLAHGRYAPLELLIELGRLSYRAYEAWRGGEVATLDRDLLGSSRRIVAILRDAAAWLKSLGLSPEPVEYHGWGSASRRALVPSTEPELAGLLGVHYQRSAPQLDLFLDGGESALVGALRAALAARDLERGGHLLEALGARSPDHCLREDAELLLDALGGLEDGRIRQADPLELERLSERLAPAAARLLGAGSRDFMAPFWRHLAAKLEGRPFDPAAPQRHGSWLHAQCLDWQGVRASVLGNRSFEGEPVLLERLANAELRLGQRVEAIARIAELCWRFPAEAETLLETDSFVDQRIRLGWSAFLDEEPPLEVDAFPGWLLLSEPGLAARWPARPTALALRPALAFEALRALVRPAHEDHAGSDLDQRRALQAHDPALLALYLRRRGVDGASGRPA